MKTKQRTLLHLAVTTTDFHHQPRHISHIMLEMLAHMYAREVCHTATKRYSFDQGMDGRVVWQEHE
jgi:hypothetical protein